MNINIREFCGSPIELRPIKGRGKWWSVIVSSIPSEHQTELDRRTFNNYVGWTPTFDESERNLLRHKMFERKLFWWSVMLLFFAVIVLSLWQR